MSVTRRTSKRHQTEQATLFKTLIEYLISQTGTLQVLLSKYSVQFVNDIKYSLKHTNPNKSYLIWNYYLLLIKHGSEPFFVIGYHCM